MSALTPIVSQFPSRGRGWDWGQHLAHGYVGGEDYETASGTYLNAPVAGIAIANNFLKTVTINIGDGRSIKLRHVNPVGIFPREVSNKSVIATSGAEGGKWPHYEGYVNGVRTTFTGMIAAYQSALALAANSQGVDVRKVAKFLNNKFAGRYHSNAADNGITGRIYWIMVQRWGKANGLYGKGYLVTGISGPQSRRVEQYLNTHI